MKKFLSALLLAFAISGIVNLGAQPPAPPAPVPVAEEPPLKDYVKLIDVVMPEIEAKIFPPFTNRLKVWGHKDSSIMLNPQNGKLYITTPAGKAVWFESEHSILYTHSPDDPMAEVKEHEGFILTVKPEWRVHVCFGDPGLYFYVNSPPP